jgi:hypothetical protein
MQGLDVDGFLKIATELLDAGESRTWNKCTNEEVILLAFDLHLADVPLLRIHQVNDWLGTLWHG